MCLVDFPSRKTILFLLNNHADFPECKAWRLCTPGDSPVLKISAAAGGRMMLKLSHEFQGVFEREQNIFLVFKFFDLKRALNQAPQKSF